VLTPAEIERLLTRNDWRSALSIALDWALVFASLALVAAAPDLLSWALTALLAIFVIGGRQLGFAVLMHEAAHRTLFANRRLNDFAGNWLCA